MLRALFFIEEALLLMRRKTRLWSSLFCFFGIVFIMVFPTNHRSLMALPLNMVKASIVFMCMMLLLWLADLILHMQWRPFSRLFKAVIPLLFMSLVIISLPAFLLSHHLVTTIFERPVIGRFIFTLLPYYNFVLFGWSAETLTHGWRRNVIALVGITLIISAQYILAGITI